MIQSIDEIKKLTPDDCFDFIGFGKNRGLRLHEVDDHYINYLSKNTQISTKVLYEMQSNCRQFWQSKLLDIENIDSIDSSLYNHQKQFLELTKGRKAFGMYFDMGTGKTRCALAFAKMRNVKITLIVCPKIVFSSWQKEIERYIKPKEFDIVTITGTAKQKLDNVKIQASFYITNYETLLNDEIFNQLKNKCELLILDESHKIKSWSAKVTQKALKLSVFAQYRLCLSGTPITNKESDIFSQIMFLDYGHNFGQNYYKFLDEYFYKDRFNRPFFKDQKRQQFTDILSKISFHVRKEDCLDLPEKTRIIYNVQLGKKSTEIFIKVKNQSMLILNDSLVETNHKITAILRMRQVTGGTLYTYQTDAKGENVKNSRKTEIVGTEKLDALFEIIEDKSEPIVIICNFQGEIDMILGHAKKKNFKIKAIYGKTSNNDRTENLSEFQAGRLDAIILQLDSASIGIDGLQDVTSTMVFYSVNYRYDSVIQAEDRIHRSGQTKKCTYIYLEAVTEQGRPTIDAVMQGVLEQKKNNIESLTKMIKETLEKE